MLSTYESRSIYNISKTEQGLRLPTMDLLFEYMNYFDKEANELLGIYGDGQNSIDSRLANQTCIMETINRRKTDRYAGTKRTKGKDISVSFY